MSLFDIIKGVTTAGLCTILSLNSGCAIRQGDERVSFFALPFVPVAAVSYEEFRPGTDEVIAKKDISVSSFLGNVHMEVKNYEKGVYCGRYKIKIDGKLGEFDVNNITTEYYDNKNNLIKTEKGMPNDVPSDLRVK